MDNKMRAKAFAFGAFIGAVATAVAAAAMIIVLHR